MKINYGFKEFEGSGSVFLREGNLLGYFPNNLSHYFGISLLNEWDDPIKLVDSIVEDYDKVFVGKNFAEFTKNGKKCEITMGINKITINSEYDCNIDLDFRKIYDFNDKERFYETKKEKNLIIVKCIQQKNVYWLAIKGEISLKNIWIEKHYSFDKKRGDKSSAWVYHLGKGKKIVLAFGKTKIEAKKFVKIKFETKKKFLGINNLLDFRLEQLLHKNRILAGLPWFFQAWSRDELISLIGYNNNFTKERILAYNNSLMKDGRLPNRLPTANLGSADSIGILAFRIRKNFRIFNAKEKSLLIKLLNSAQKRIEKNYEKNGLIKNYDKETWMDTISREGYNIEIQALYANLLDAINHHKKNDFINNVRKQFNKKLDNLDNDKIRPNIFLAYYYYPRLFTKKEWEKKFHKVIDECWLNWGGFSTISKNSKLYHPYDEGITDISYHNGNSWYFINNIAAIVMLDFEKLKSYAKKIYDASIKECLTSGLLGCSAEISDANSLTSKGCLFQAWSVATLKELHKKIN